MIFNVKIRTFSLKSSPIVASVFIGNLPAQNLKERQVFPTPDSPKTIILKLRGLTRGWGDVFAGTFGMAVVGWSEVSLIALLSFNRALEILDSSLCALDIYMVSVNKFEYSMDSGQDIYKT